ncbi:DUF397 domain-containing protein [Streptomyces sp. NPDC088745]|uniref:DUF397 domain-containing protein n=1 Tax=Streptomyces sp. NPDC088745 TaxID=3365884 RepID=UPI0038007F9B
MSTILTWRKSSYSGGAGSECVEVAIEWTKSSYSTGPTSECVEVAASAAGTSIHIRDSKDITRPSLTTTPAAWAAFLTLPQAARRAP